MNTKQKHIGIILTITIAVKIAYFVMISFYGFNPDLNALKRGDSYWYERIATNGHEKITPDQLGKCEDGNIQQSYYAFFPLYPAMVGGLMKATGISFNGSAFVLSLIFSVILSLLFYSFSAAFLQSARQALYTSLLLLVLPFHYYFSMYYTEALFLILLLASFYTIFKRKPVLFAVVSSLMVLCRPNGLFLLLPLFLFAMEQERMLSIAALKASFSKLFTPVFLVFIVPILSFVAYCFYLQQMTGDFFAYKTAQAGWCRQTVMPWVPILRSNNWMDYFRVGYLFFFGLISLFWIRKIPVSFTILIWISLGLPLMADSVTLPRFISVIFVFPLFFAAYFRQRTAVNVLVLLLLFAAQLWSFHFWIEGSEFSY